MDAHLLGTCTRRVPEFGTLFCALSCALKNAENKAETSQMALGRARKNKRVPIIGILFLVNLRGYDAVPSIPRQASFQCRTAFQGRRKWWICHQNAQECPNWGEGLGPPLQGAKNALQAMLRENF